MTLSFSELLQHYTVPRDAGIFFLVSLGGILAVLLVIALYCRAKEKKAQDHYALRVRERTDWTVQRFAEILFSDTSMLAFISAYVMLDWFVVNPTARQIWTNYSDFILMGLIILSCVYNTFLDRVFLPLKKIKAEERSSLRLVSMIYMFVIFLYIKFIYEDNNYDSIITYFIGLMIGRFVFFGASLHEFVDAMKHAVHDLGMVGLSLALTAFMAWYGFGTGYLLRINGVVVSLFIAHLYLGVALFLLVRLGFVKLLTPVPKNERMKRTENRTAEAAESRRDERKRKKQIEEEWDDRRPSSAASGRDVSAEGPKRSRQRTEEPVRPQRRRSRYEAPAPEQRYGAEEEEPGRTEPVRQRRAVHSRNFVEIEEEPLEIDIGDPEDEDDGFLDD